MKIRKYLIILINIFSIILLIGCEGPKFISYERIRETQVETVEKDLTHLFERTHPSFLDALISSLTLPENIYQQIGRNDKITIQSLDRNYQSDTDAQLIIQRNLINKFVKRNINVLDRDENILTTSLIESSNDIGKRWFYYSSRYNDSTQFINIDGAVSRATKILGYRVLEFGYILIPKKNKSLQRIGYVKLELRLVDVPTTQILFSDIVSSNYTDILSTDDFQIIDKLHFTTSQYSLPLTKESTSKTLLFTDLEKQEIKSIGKLRILVQKGDRSGELRIISDLEQRTVRSFNIPSLSTGGDTYYKIEFELVDFNQKPLPAGSYSIYLDNLLVGKFDI